MLSNEEMNYEFIMYVVAGCVISTIIAFVFG